MQPLQVLAARTRRHAGIGLFWLVAVVGLVVSILVFRMVDSLEHERIRNAFQVEVDARSKEIEQRLRDGTLPVATLAVYLAGNPNPSTGEFAAWTSRAAAMGVLIGRLAWEPLVRGNQREAFEHEAQQAGLSNYQITEFTAEGRFTSAAPRAEYFPVRAETLQTNYPSNLGFDIGSDPNRRRAIDLARDLGQPVALRPALRQVSMQTQPTYVIYWPLYAGGVVPATVTERRGSLVGYVTALVRLSDALDHALATVSSGMTTILFSAAPAGAPVPSTIIASYVPGQGLTVGDRPAPEADANALIFHRAFTVLQQQWFLEFRVPVEATHALRSLAPWSLAGLGLLITAALAGQSLAVAKRSDADQVRHLETQGLMTTLAQTNAALSLANEQLAERGRAAADMAHARTRFLASASHDLRQPLHALALFTSALQRRVSDPVGTELVGHIQDLTQSMQNMFNSLLDLSRLDAGAVSAKPEAMLPAGLLAKLVGEFAVVATAKGLRVRQLGTFPMVRTDPNLLEAILRNLIGNAVKFTDKGGIIVAGRSRGETLAIEIWDTGLGIPATQQDLIFQEFERLEITSSKPGFGLGLPIVRQFCGLIGAGITVCSRPGHGSRFTVTLPRITQAAPGAGEAAGDGALAPAPPASLDGTQVLLVDNDADVQRALSLELEDLGCIMHAASNGEEALAHFHAGGNPKLVILDLHFGTGQKDGWAIADELRALRPAQVIILVSGSTDPATLERIHHSGLPSMVKPVHPETLYKVITEMIEATPV